MFKFIENALEHLMFSSRWLLAPFYVGLVFAIVLVLAKFIEEIFHLAPHIIDMSESAVVLGVLTMVDLSLVANLLLIIIFSGYENFVSKINVAEHEDRPEWMGKVDFSGLKIKLIGSIVAISGIELLKAFVNIKDMSEHSLIWMATIHVILVFTGVLFAFMDKIAESNHQAHKDNDHH
ncbi:MAG: TIGR00645 family protein [Gammaproteobacteria bacterium]|nr:TIGR00645 family protein [Gammaproteobacteria bacterium]